MTWFCKLQLRLLRVPADSLVSAGYDTKRHDFLPSSQELSTRSVAPSLSSVTPLWGAYEATRRLVRPLRDDTAAFLRQKDEDFALTQ